MTAHKYRNAGWTEAEMDLIRDNINLSPIELAKLFEGTRTLAAVSQAKFRLAGRKPAKVVEYEVKAPGDYIEHLSLFLVEDFECMGIWARWHGYATWELMSTDERGFAHVRCTAKG
jgi:hypothetical protein